MPEITVLQTGIRITIEDAIRACASAFEEHKLVFGHGTADAIAEASWLVLYGMSLSPQNAPDYTQTLTESEVQKVNEIAARRIVERVPAAYITGSAWFAGLEFKSDERALVPRSPLAEYICDDFFGMLDVSSKCSILDLCTGGGCIAIACAVQMPTASVDASDLSSSALSLAKENVALHQMEERVQLVQGSLFENIEDKYNLIISNPPYVDQQDIDAMGAEFEHEPLMGLAAGDDGLDLVRIMLQEATEYLTEDGLLVVEVGNSAEALENAYPTVPFQWLEFEYGGSGIFALTRKELAEHADAIEAGLLR